MGGSAGGLYFELTSSGPRSRCKSFLSDPKREERRYSFGPKSRHRLLSSNPSPHRSLSIPFDTWKTYFNRLLAPAEKLFRFSCKRPIGQTRQISHLSQIKRRLIARLGLPSKCGRGILEHNMEYRSTRIPSGILFVALLFSSVGGSSSRSCEATSLQLNLGIHNRLSSDFCSAGLAKFLVRLLSLEAFGSPEWSLRATDCSKLFPTADATANTACCSSSGSSIWETCLFGCLLALLTDWCSSGSVLTIRLSRIF
jgi:hypothetical protein